MPSPKADDEAQERKLLEPPSILQIGDYMATDIVVESHGSIFLLRPISDSGRMWIEENIGQQNGFQPYWPTVVALNSKVNGEEAQPSAILMLWCSAKSFLLNWLMPRQL